MQTNTMTPKPDTIEDQTAQAVDPATPLFAPLPLRWKVHSSRLLNEALSNSTTSALKVPLNIFGKLLGAVGERAAELNDPRLNELMCRLTIYTAADPDSPDYDPDAVDDVSRLAQAARANVQAQTPRAQNHE